MYILFKRKRTPKYHTNITIKYTSMYNKQLQMYFPTCPRMNQIISFETSTIVLLQNYLKPSDTRPRTRNLVSPDCKFIPATL